MKNQAASLLVLVLACSGVHAQKPSEPDFPLTEDSKPHDGVPKGELIKFSFEQPKIFPGTVRDVTIYVPKQYDGTKPVCVYVGQDGVGFNAPTVFDNLIHKHEIPVTIGVFIMPGRVNGILPTPNGRVSNVAFGGADFDTLFATCGDKVFKRKLKARGAQGFLPPVKPAAPRL